MRTNREHGANHPIGSRPETIEPEKIDVLVGDAAEKAENVFDLQILALLVLAGWRAGSLAGAFDRNPLGNDSCNPFADIVIRLASTTSILGLLATALDVAADA